MIQCEECDAEIPSHKWGKIQKGADWFFTRDNKAYCPKHIPDWVPAWREKQKEKE